MFSPRLPSRGPPLPTPGKERKGALTTILHQLSLILGQSHHLSADPIAGLDGSGGCTLMRPRIWPVATDRKIASYTAC